MENAKLQFVVNGFKEVQGFRIFSFERVGADRSRTPFTVRTDLALSRRYGIPMQELPLLCRSVLEQCSNDEDNRSFTYGEDAMCLYAARAAARDEAAKLRRPRKAPTGNLGAAWRGPQPQP